MMRRGSITITVALFLVGLLATIAVLVTSLSAVVAQHQAHTAADLAALAAAVQIQRSPLQQACAVAGQVASRNGGTLRSCQRHGAGVAVQVDVPSVGIASGQVVAQAAAEPFGEPRSPSPRL